MNASAVSWTICSAGVRLLQGVADAFEQVRFAQPDGAVDHQRVEGRAGRLRHLS